MRYYALFCLLLLVACAAPSAPVQPPAQPIAQQEVIAPPVAQVEKKVPTLGAVNLEIFAYGAREVGGSINPLTPLEYRVQVSQDAPNSPPITHAFRPTIFLVVIYKDGSFDTFGTEDVPNIQASNLFTYDPSLERWVNTKGMSKGDVNDQQKFVVLVRFNDDKKLIQRTINIR